MDDVKSILVTVRWSEYQHSPEDKPEIFVVYEGTETYLDDFALDRPVGKWREVVKGGILNPYRQLTMETYFRP
ncbi:MAG TPA: hypothetical protein ENN60_00580 [archaeon]|nr:hypothetical protein [archaeon]